MLARTRLGTRTSLGTETKEKANRAKRALRPQKRKKTKKRKKKVFYFFFKKRQQCQSLLSIFKSSFNSVASPSSFHLNWTAWISTPFSFDS